MCACVCARVRAREWANTYVVCGLVCYPFLPFWSEVLMRWGCVYMSAYVACFVFRCEVKISVLSWSEAFLLRGCVWMCTCLCMCMQYVCVCLCVRASESARVSEYVCMWASALHFSIFSWSEIYWCIEKERERERVCVCVCVYVCARARASVRARMLVSLCVTLFCLFLLKRNVNALRVCVCVCVCVCVYARESERARMHAQASVYHVCLIVRYTFLSFSEAKFSCFEGVYVKNFWLHVRVTLRSVYACLCMYACMHTCVHVFLCMCVCVCVCMCEFMCVRVYVNM